ncbi:MAG TPA: hypothetical protein VGF40_18305 [Thermoanaerobaculia bacterium]
MNRTAVVSVVCALLLAGTAAADEPKKAEAKGEKAKTISQQPAPPKDSPLVRAAKAAQKSRQKSGAGGKVITDASVKQSKGRLTILAESTAPPAEAVEAAVVNEQRARAAAAAEAEKVRLEIESLRAEVARHEKALAEIEASYYDEFDAETREATWEDSFSKTKAALDAAREKLAAAQKRQKELVVPATTPKP